MLLHNIVFAAYILGELFKNTYTVIIFNKDKRNKLSLSLRNYIYTCNNTTTRIMFPDNIMREVQ